MKRGRLNRRIIRNAAAFTAPSVHSAIGTTPRQRWGCKEAACLLNCSSGFCWPSPCTFPGITEIRQWNTWKKAQLSEQRWSTATSSCHYFQGFGSFQSQGSSGLHTHLQVPPPVSWCVHSWYLQAPPHFNGARLVESWEYLFSTPQPVHWTSAPDVHLWDRHVTQHHPTHAASLRLLPAVYRTLPVPDLHAALGHSHRQGEFTVIQSISTVLDILTGTWVCLGHNIWNICHSF